MAPVSATWPATLSLVSGSRAARNGRPTESVWAMTKRRSRVRAEVGSIATDQHDGGSFGRGVGRRGQRDHVEFATDKLGGGRRCARGRVVQDTAATHETKVGPRWRPSQEYL